MEIKVKSLEDTMTVRENGCFMEFTIKQEEDFCVMFIGKKEAKQIAQKLIEWAGKKEINSTEAQLQQANVSGQVCGTCGSKDVTDWNAYYRCNECDSKC